MIKKEKYFYIESIQDLDLEYIKKTKAKLIIRDKTEHNFSIIYQLISECKKRGIIVYISNNAKLLFRLRLNTFYISSSNYKHYNWLYNVNKNIKIIGGAHNQNEIKQKINQGCREIVLSRLFKTYKAGFLNIIRFNNLTLNKKTTFIALGGINHSNYRKLKIVNCSGIAMLSEQKNKPKYLIG